MVSFGRRNFSGPIQRDKISRRKRSALMAKIRSSGTRFELSFIHLLKRSTRSSFSVNVRTLVGKPDIVFRRCRVCVFLDSDFWHGWQFPRWQHRLKNDWWREKIRNNRKRDRRVTRLLRSDGWRVIRIWERDIVRNPASVITEVVTAIIPTHPKSKTRPPLHKP